MAAARQQVTKNPQRAEAYNTLALALIARAQETASPEFDRQAAEAIATGFSLAPQDFQLRKAHVALLLDEHDFTHARDEARDLNQHNPDDVTVHGYLARAEMALGDDKAAEESAQWMLNMLPFNVPGLLIAADLRVHFGDPEGALEVLNRAYAETSPSETGNWRRSPIRLRPLRLRPATSRPPARWCSARMSYSRVTRKRRRTRRFSPPCHIRLRRLRR